MGGPPWEKLEGRSCRWFVDLVVRFAEGEEKEVGEGRRRGREWLCWWFESAPALILALCRQ